MPAPPKSRRPVLVATAAATLATGLAVYAYARNRTRASLPVAPHVDLKRYAGLWYEIARLPARFEKGCQHVTAEYKLRPDGKVSVLNTCRQGALDGPVETAKGVARVADSNTNAKLKVSFFGPFEGDYWILELDPDYRYALVGEPGRKNCWILSRTPQLAQTTREKLAATARAQGFPVEKLIYTQQPMASKP